MNWKLIAVGMLTGVVTGNLILAILTSAGFPDLIWEDFWLFFTFPSLIVTNCIGGALGTMASTQIAKSIISKYRAINLTKDQHVSKPKHIFSATVLPGGVIGGTLSAIIFFIYLIS